MNFFIKTSLLGILLISLGTIQSMTSPDFRFEAVRSEEGIQIMRLMKLKKKDLFLIPFAGMKFSHPTLLFSPDSATLCIANGCAVTALWDIQSKKQIGNANIDRPLCFSPDSKWLVTELDSTVGIWSVKSESVLLLDNFYLEKIEFDVNKVYLCGTSDQLKSSQTKTEVIVADLTSLKITHRDTIKEIPSDFNVHILKTYGRDDSGVATPASATPIPMPSLEEAEPGTLSNVLNCLFG